MKRFVPHSGSVRRAAFVAVLLGSTALSVSVYAWAAAPTATDVVPQTGAQTTQVQVNNPDSSVPPVNTKQQTQAAMPQQLPNFTQLVAQVKPAVVSVTNYLKQNEAGDQGMPGMQQLPFPFNQFPFNQMTPQHQRPVEARAPASSSTRTG